MIDTTQCYIRQGSRCLMLHRIKKKNDLNEGKWIGIGGKFEGNESPEECLLRETLEETGLTLTDWRCRGIVTFVSDRWPAERMYVFTADGFTGELKECDEGVLEWLEWDQLTRIPHWEGDEIYLRLIEQDAPFFSLKVCYEGDKLVSAALDGKRIR